MLKSNSSIHMMLKDFSKRHILISTSKDIYTNLAFEDYLYTNSFIRDRFLFIYMNNPSVIIGRFQNIWKETNPFFLHRNNIKLARRRSGGGAVYHDQGNINLSFFSHKKDYNRKSNLELITKALQSLGVISSVNDKDDIIINDKKISGSAAKLGQNLCYHHCTLLVESDLTNINATLKPALEPFMLDCKGTNSKRSNVINLKDINKTLSKNIVIEAICLSYNHSTLIKDDDDDVTIIEPNEQNFPGLDKIIRGLESWDWIYCKGPKFSLRFGDIVGTQTDEVPPSRYPSHILIKIDQGCIQNITYGSHPPPNDGSKLSFAKVESDNIVTVDLEKYRLCFTLSNLTGPIVRENVAKRIGPGYAKLFVTAMREKLGDKLL